jgi:hypothetical protein
MIIILVPIVVGATDNKTSDAGIVDPFLVIKTFDQFAERKLWPDFDPRQLPIAIYDGNRTLLLRHPSPTEEFQPLAGHDGVWVFEGRHQAMRWNSTAPIGEVRTATLVLTIEPGRAVELEASYLLHEVFHLFSKQRHPTWSPNEMLRYSYPIADQESYFLLIYEEELLARAVEADDDDVAASWAMAALTARRDRVRSLAPEHLEYDNALEMQEGTAVYMARLVVDKVRDTSRLREERPPESIRWRFYDTGAALAALLDRLDPDWKHELEARPEVTMAELLETALASRKVTPRVIEKSDLEALLTRAEIGIAELAARREQLRRDFSASGIRIVVVAGTEPLQIRPGQFNPLALEILDQGEVLHYGQLTLTTADGQIEYKNPYYRRGTVAGVLALTTPASDQHPLLHGLSRAAFTGFAGGPSVKQCQGEVLIEADGLTISFRGARVTTSENEIVVVLPDAKEAAS